jgi:serine/threonine protein kinase/WD40 repeat protein
MTNPQSQRNPLEEMAEEFLERYRRGERPALTEYTRKHPELSDKIRELFPALVLLEEVGPQEAGPPGACSGRMTADGKALERLGDYRILAEVARGGMGVVYEAEQEALGRHVALKVLPYQSPMDPIRLQRFRRESRSAARLHHTNIVPVFDVGEYEGTHYYAMQFIRGQALDEVLTELKHMRGGKHDASVTGPADGPALTPIRQLTVILARNLLTGQFSRESLAEEEAGEAQPQPASPDAEVIRSEALPGRIANPSYPSENPVGRICNPSSASVGVSSSILKIRSDLSSSGDSHYFRSVAQLGLQVADALAYAHGQKVLHRDIKPANLLLDFQGTVWVTDFGLAKEEGEDLTRTGDLVGTLRYMAPERFNGESDPRSDIYSLGLTLYELLTSRPAFEESDRSRLINRIVHEDPVRPRKRDPQIPRDLETIVLKAIAKDPKERYQAAEEMAEDLRRFLADRPIQARRSAAWEHAWRWCRRNRLLATLSAAVLVLVVALGVGFLVAELLWTERDLALASQKRAEDAEGRARAAERENKVREHLAQAGSYRRSGRVGQRFKALAEIRAAVKLDPAPELRRELRNEAIACLVLPDLEVAKEWDGYPAGTDAVEFAPSFAHYARSDLQGNISIRRLKDHEQIAHIRGEGKRVALRFSPDGQYLAVLAQFQPTFLLQVWQLGGAGPRVVVDEPANTGWSFDFTPDSRQIIIGCRDTRLRDGSIRIYNLPSGKLSRQLNPAPHGFYSGVKLHPKKPLLAVTVHGSKSVQLLHLQNGQTLAELPHPDGTQDYAWHPDGESLAVACLDRKIYLWDVPARKQTAVLEGHTTDGHQLTFNHAGTVLASNDFARVLRLWDTRTGRQIFKAPAASCSPRFSPDDQLLAAEVKGSKLRLFRVADGRELRTLPRPSMPGGRGYSYVTPAPDSRLLAAAISPRWQVRFRYSGVALLDLATGKELAVLPGDQQVPVRFDAAGRLLTHGQAKLLKWPVQKNILSGLLRFGPPRILGSATTVGGTGVSADARVLALARPGKCALLLHRERPGTFIELAPQDDVRYCDVSSDGQWVATGSHNSQNVFVKVWDGQTGKHVKDLPVHGHGGGRFSTDGRWLATTGGGCRLWAVGSWQEGPKISGEHFAFSPDSNVLAVGDGFDVVHLYDPNTGREHARLEIGSQARSLPECFTPDGAHLIATNSEDGTIQIWNLAAIRTQLAELGLDWDPKSIPPARPPGRPVPLSVDVDSGYLEGARFAKLQQWDKAAAVFDQACVQQPEWWDFWLGRAVAHLAMRDKAGYRAACMGALARFRTTPDLEAAAYVSWACALGPASGVDQAELVRLAERAHAGNRGQYLYLRSLGACLYRAGRYQEALRRLQQASRTNADSPMTGLLLALAHYQLGQTAVARRRLRQACQRIDEILADQDRRMHWTEPTGLRLLRREAEAAVGGPGPPAAHGPK